MITLVAWLQVKEVFMSGLQAVASISTGRAASMADVAAAYNMMQHYLKAVAMPAPDGTQVCHASHHGTQVSHSRLLFVLPGSRGFAALCISCEYQTDGNHCNVIVTHFYIMIFSSMWRANWGPSTSALCC